VFRDVSIIPPGSGIGGMHQQNIESTVHVVCCTSDGWLYPDSVLGTDSHTAASSGLGVLSVGEFYHRYSVCFPVYPF